MNPPPNLQLADPPRVDKEGAPFQIRDYHPTDFPELLEFYGEFEPKRAAQGLPPADPERIGQWLTSIVDRGLHKVAVRSGRLIGHGFVTPTERDGIGEYAVFLHQDERGKGVGTELNRAVAGSAREQGLRGLWLTVEPRNRAAVRSYEKVGFQFVMSTVFSIEPEMELRL